jgi:hypothetical protein
MFQPWHSIWWYLSVCCHQSKYVSRICCKVIAIQTLAVGLILISSFHMISLVGFYCFII